MKSTTNAANCAANSTWTKNTKASKIATQSRSKSSILKTQSLTTWKYYLNISNKIYKLIKCHYWCLSPKFFKSQFNPKFPILPIIIFLTLQDKYYRIEVQFSELRVQSEKYVLIQNETFQYQQEIERLTQKLKIKNIEMDDLAFKL